MLMSFVGATVEEAYLILLDTTLLVYFIPYAYMFAAYLRLRATGLGDEDALRVPSNKSVAYLFGFCGLFTTILAMVMSVVPSSGTTNVLVYELKVIGGFLLFILVGAGIYWSKSRK